MLIHAKGEAYLYTGRFPDPATRFAMVTALLLCPVVAVYQAVRRWYGQEVARRLARVMLGALVVQQALVALTLWRKPNPGGPGPVDLMTLSRGVASAVLLGLAGSGVRDRHGPAGWLGWCSVLYGAIVCDWLDGPLARRTATSEAGAIFDLEGDSWLTVCTAVAAATWGGLAARAVIPPLLRYPLFFAAVCRRGYAGAASGDPPWSRRIGIAQMALFLAALAPFGGRMTGWLVWVLGPLNLPLQVGGLALLYRKKLRS